MSKKMTERNRAIIVNAAILGGLIWCFISGYPPKIILGSGVFLLVFANMLMYYRRRHSATKV